MVMAIKKIDKTKARGNFCCAFSILLTCTEANSIPKNEVMIAVNEIQESELDKCGIMVFAAKCTYKGLPEKTQISAIIIIAAIGTNMPNTAQKLAKRAEV